MTSECYSDARYFEAGLYGLADIQQSIAHLIGQATYLSDTEKQQLIDCCFFAAQAHAGQVRQSGEPYACHPIKVAGILAKEVHFDLPVLQAAVLHDVIEDTPVSKDELEEVFGAEVAGLVDGVSKLEKDKGLSAKELQARTFEKLVHAMQADPRVVMIKFADRMHNMQTLGVLRPDKRKRIANETLDVYVPIASHLGMFIFKTELEELAFKHLYPWRYQVIQRWVKENVKRKEIVAQTIKELHLQFTKQGVNATIRERRRNLLNIYRKLKKNRLKRRPFERTSIPFIVLTDSVDDCYRALGVIHQFYMSVFHKLTDYIASPRVNGYQSIHTSVLTAGRQVINFQIRTKEMHAVAESGIIAIWRYHNQAESDGGIWRLPEDKSMRRWLDNFKTASKLSTDSVEFYEAVKRDLSGFDIQVLTPKGEPIALPKGATVIDFAYHIHTDIGNRLLKARVNGVEVLPKHTLDDGQMVELVTDADARPRSLWLRYAKTARAKTGIRHYLRGLSDEALAKEGRREIKRYLAKRNITYRSLEKMLAQIAEHQYQLSLPALLHKIALREIKYRQLLNYLQKIAHKEGIIANISLTVRNQPKVLSKISKIIGDNKANILRIRFPDDIQTEQVQITFEIQLEFNAQLDNIIRSIKQLKFIKQIQYEEMIR
ncbi:MAG: guanosine-3',5'-bis(diphosphate) 3'-pyrophosphohydrolase [Gammaproteobacteria bacterium]|nr:MAG: guanosine-3',5'-bis(diphosphate) 3'-pyrophosphohydrolase [Gammaproteobacteria bacterium]